MVQSRTARCAFQSPYLTDGIEVRVFNITYLDERGPIPNGGHLIVAAGVSRPAGSISHHRCARFRTQRLTPADLCRGSRVVPERPEAEAWKEKSWESLRVRLQSSRAALPASAVPQQSASSRRAPSSSSSAAGKKRSTLLWPTLGPMPAR